MAFKQLLLTGLVEPISKEDRQFCVPRMSKRLCAKSAMKKLEVHVKPKNLVHRPKKPNPPMNTAPMSTFTSVVEQSFNRSRSLRGSYIN